MIANKEIVFLNNTEEPKATDLNVADKAIAF